MQASDDNHPIGDRIRDFIATNLLYTSEGFPYSDDASFMQEGIVDSLGVLQLVEFTQKEFQLSVEQQEVIPANFDSVSQISAFVRRKLDAKASPASK